MPSLAIAEIAESRMVFDSCRIQIHPFSQILFFNSFIESSVHTNKEWCMTWKGFNFDISTTPKTVSIFLRRVASLSETRKPPNAECPKSMYQELSSPITCKSLFR